MSKSPVEHARVRDDSCCRVEDTLQLVGRLPRSANQETASVIDSVRDERMNECSDECCDVVILSLSVRVRLKESDFHSLKFKDYYYCQLLIFLN